MGKSPIVIPILCLLGYYFSERQILRVICAVILWVWVGLVCAVAVINRSWEILIFPAVVALAWVWISEVKKSVE